MEDRRSSERCPDCQGPVKIQADEVVCRNSLCSYNHRDRVCSRCDEKAAEALGYQDGLFEFRCRECLNKWKDN